MKYVFIVQNTKVLEFGEERTQKVFFLINLALPMLLTILAMVTADWESHSSLSSCFGETEQVLAHYNTSTAPIKTSRNFFFEKFLCNLKNNDTEDLDVYTFHVIKQCFCAFKSTAVMVINTNLLEGFFYYKIFRKAKW